MDLEKSLEEAVKVFRANLDKNPDLQREFNRPPNTPLEGRNEFEVSANLVRRLRDAYMKNDLETLNSIPLYHPETPGEQAICYTHANLKDDVRSERCLPFGNETVGENVYWINDLLFDKIADLGDIPDFYIYLLEKIEEFETSRDSVRREILDSERFQEIKRRLVPAHFTDTYTKKNVEWYERPDRALLVKAWRDEEFKRKDKILDLCDKAEHIYELASRLFEALRPLN